MHKVLSDSLLIILLSGPVAVGKSTVTKLLTEDYGFHTIRSGSYLASLAVQHGVPTDRTSLQELGDSLDARTDFEWIVNEVSAPLIRSNPEQQRWLLDSVRKEKQVAHFKGTFGKAVYHIHLTAPDETLRARYNDRLAAGVSHAGATDYDVAIQHPNEIASRQLIARADAVIDVSSLTTENIVKKIIDALSLHGVTN